MLDPTLISDPVEVAYPTSSQRRLLWTTLVALALTALLGVAALVFFLFITFLSWCYPILLPIGLAVIVALILEPIVNFLQRRGLHRGPAILLVCSMAIMGFIVFWAFLLPPLLQQTGDFLNRVPNLIDEGTAKLKDSLDRKPGAHPVTPAHTGHTTLHASDIVPQSQAQAWLESNLASMQQDLPKNIAHLFYAGLGPVGQMLGFILGFGFVPIYVYYFLADQEHLSRNWKEFVPLPEGPFRDEVVAVLAEINQSLVSYLRGQIIVAACNGVLTFIGLSLIHIPYSLVLGVIAGALSIVPFLGIIVSILPALLLAFFSAHGNPTWQWLGPVLVLVVFAVVQMSESMLITPRVQSHSTGLHPLVIILGILVWSMLLPGLLGPVVAVPLTCAIVVLLRRYVWRKPKPVSSP